MRKLFSYFKTVAISLLLSLDNMHTYAHADLLTLTFDLLTCISLGHVPLNESDMKTTFKIVIPHFMSELCETSRPN